MVHRLPVPAAVRQVLPLLKLRLLQGATHNGVAVTVHPVGAFVRSLCLVRFIPQPDRQFNLWVFFEEASTIQKITSQYMEFVGWFAFSKYLAYASLAHSSPESAKFFFGVFLSDSYHLQQFVHVA